MSGSEVRPARHRYWFFLLAEGIEAFPISAARFNNRSLRFAPMHLDAHRLNKGCRIFDGDFRLQSFAAVDQVIALHDMKFLAVGRAEVVDKGPRVLSKWYRPPAIRPRNVQSILRTRMVSDSANEARPCRYDAPPDRPG